MSSKLAEAYNTKLLLPKAIRESDFRHDWFMRVAEPFFEKLPNVGHSDVVEIHGTKFEVRCIASSTNDISFFSLEDDRVTAYIYNHSEPKNSLIVFNETKIPRRTVFNLNEDLDEEPDPVIISGTIEPSYYNHSKNSAVSITENLDVFYKRVTHFCNDNNTISQVTTGTKDGLVFGQVTKDFKVLSYNGHYTSYERTTFSDIVAPWTIRAQGHAETPGIAFISGDELFGHDNKPIAPNLELTAITTHHNNGNEAIVKFRLEGKTFFEATFCRNNHNIFELRGPALLDIRGDTNIQGNFYYYMGCLHGPQDLTIEDDSFKNTYIGRFSLGQLGSFNDDPSMIHTKLSKKDGVEDTYQTWMWVGSLHRDLGPAYIHTRKTPGGESETVEWMYSKNGLKHRTNGPAHSGSPERFVNGSPVTVHTILGDPRKSIAQPNTSKNRTISENYHNHFELLLKHHQIHFTDDLGNPKYTFCSFFGENIKVIKYHDNGHHIVNLWGLPLAQFESDGTLLSVRCRPNIQDVETLKYEDKQWHFRFVDGDHLYIKDFDEEEPSISLKVFSSLPSYALHRVLTETISTSLGIQHPAMAEILGMVVPILISHNSNSEEVQKKCEEILRVALHSNGRALLDQVSQKIFSPESRILETFSNLPQELHILTEAESTELLPTEQVLEDLI